ncbi:MAG: tetratricopeptide repeat protein [Paracoccaceae bacterium]
MSFRPAGLCALGMILLAACSSGGFRASGDAARNLAPGADGSETGVDGLLVGHRLMEAGEYELALKAYLRAASEQGINSDVLSALGAANLHLGRLGQAEALLRKAVETDERNVPALNNLGVVLMERGKLGEARMVFQNAYALDSGESDSIRENLRLAIAKTESPVYGEPKEDPKFSLVRRGQGEYVLLSQL